MGRRRHLLIAGGLTAAALSTGGSLTYYDETLPTTLNPLYASSMVDFRSQELIFDRLWFNSSINNELESRVVDSWEMADGGRAIRLTLKSSIKWHDGKPFTSKDICFTVQAMLDPGTPSPIAEGYRDILAGCKTEGNSVAKVTFKKVFHNPRQRLGFAVLPRHAFRNNTRISPDLEFSARPIGTGAMKGSRGTRGVVFSAVENPHHRAKIPQLQMQEGNDPLLQVRAIMNNAVQGIIAVSPPYRAEISARDELALKSYDLRSWWFIALNTAKAPLNNAKVRQALDYILDRNELREKSIGVKPGERNSPCEFISGPFVQSSPYYNRQVPTKDRSDMAKASALLTEAGLKKTGGTWSSRGAAVNFRLGMLKSMNTEAPDLLEYVGNQFGAAGFGRQSFKISTDEWNREMLTGKAKNYDMLIGKWSFGQVEDVNDLFNTRKTGKGTRNIFNYSRADVDKLLDNYDRAKTDTAAKDAYHKLHAYLADDLPYLFLWKLDTKSAWRTEVKSNTISPYFYFTEFDSWKYDG